jgi:hypothetical protein
MTSTVEMTEDKQDGSPSHNERNKMLMTILLVLLVMMLFGALPSWPHSRNWGYYPSGGLGLILMILIVLLLLGRI